MFQIVNKYKKTNQGSWDENVMQTSIHLGKAIESIKGTAKRYELAYATLYSNGKSDSLAPKLGRFRPVFTED